MCFDGNFEKKGEKKEAISDGGVFEATVPNRLADVRLRSLTDLFPMFTRGVTMIRVSGEDCNFLVRP